MTHEKTDRRDFIKKSIVASAATGAALSQMTAVSYGRILGANGRVALGLIGCGVRGRWIMENMVDPAQDNIALVAVNDIWKHRMEVYPDQLVEKFGEKPHPKADYGDVLDDKNIDAVIIATPAHQHCGQLIDAAQAGKHAYVEKPIAPLMESLAELNAAYDVVKKSGIVVQHGTQGSTGSQTPALRDFLASGKLGKLFRVESSISLREPYWNLYTEGPKSEDETDWKAFLYGKPDRPFDADMHSAWMGYRDFSSGPICGWMAHFSNFVHAVTGCGCPKKATAWGGIYAPSSDSRRTAPDNVSVLLEYEEGFHTEFVTHFGSTHDTESTRFMLEKGMVRTRFGHDPGNPVVSSEGVDDSIAATNLLDNAPLYPGRDHFRNWLHAIRNGDPTTADMEMGYRQGVATALGDAAYSLGRKVTFDSDRREIRTN